MICHFAQLTELNASEFKEAMALLENDVRKSYENLYENRDWQFLNAAGGFDEKILKTIFLEDALDHPFNRDRVKAIKGLAIDYLVCQWKLNTLKQQLNAELKALDNAFSDDIF